MGRLKVSSVVGVIDALNPSGADLDAEDEHLKHRMELSVGAWTRMGLRMTSSPGVSSLGVSRSRQGNDASWVWIGLKGFDRYFACCTQ